MLEYISYQLNRDAILYNLLFSQNCTSAFQSITILVCSAQNINTYHLDCPNTHFSVPHDFTARAAAACAGL